jgi:hypothetical protein
MSTKMRERLRALAHSALVHLEGIDAHARARRDDPAEATQLERDIEAIRSFLLRLIGA